MTRTWKFPLVVVALSSRKVGFTSVPGPMRIDGARLWSVRHVSADARRLLLQRRILRVVQKFDPATVLITHGSRWRLSDRARRLCRAVGEEHGLVVRFLDLEKACSILGCLRDLRMAAERLLDCHPELERQVRPVLADGFTPSRRRDARPVLSALTVAHAASVAHLIKFG